MANAFDYTNLALLSLLSYARDTYGEELTLEELADQIEQDAADFFKENEVAELEQTIAQFNAESMAKMLRELAKGGYTFEDFMQSVTNLLPEDDELLAIGDDEEDDELEDEDDSEEEEDEDDEDDDELDEESEEEEDEEDEEDEDDLEEEEEDDDLDEEEEEDEDDEDDEDAPY